MISGHTFHDCPLPEGQPGPWSFLLSVALLLLVAVMTAGCLGKAPPPAKYLRLSAGECQERTEARHGGRTVAVRQLASMPSLDRQAVLLADGPVSTPSPAWSWEGAPNQILTQAVMRRLGCREGVGAVVSDRASAPADVLLTGRIERFEVQRKPGGGAEPRVELAARLELWTGDGRMLIADKRFSASERITEVTDRSVALGAQAALDRFLDEVAEWAGEALDNRK